MRIKKVKTTIQASPEVELAIQNLVPRFANKEDITIARAYSEIKHLLTLTTSKARTKDIESQERNLLWLIKNRNLSTK